MPDHDDRQAGVVLGDLVDRPSSIAQHGGAVTVPAADGELEPIYRRCGNVGRPPPSVARPMSMSPSPFQPRTENFRRYTAAFGTWAAIAHATGISRSTAGANRETSIVEFAEPPCNTRTAEVGAAGDDVDSKRAPLFLVLTI